MKKKTEHNTDSKEIKPDLKHDSMEFSAATDGEDKLDSDDDSYEEEAITADELDLIEEDGMELQAEALNAAETDRLADDDNLPEEDWTEDLPDTAASEADNDPEHHRNKKN